MLIGVLGASALLLPVLLISRTRAQPPASAPSLPELPELPEPTRLTLHLKDAEPRVAFEKLFDAAKLPFEGVEGKWFAASRSRAISVDLTDQPFLAALVELCRQGAMEPNVNQLCAAGIGFQSRMLEATVPRLLGPAKAAATTTTDPTTATTRALRPPPPPPPPRSFSVTTRRSTPAPSWVDVPYVISGPFLFAPREVVMKRTFELSGGHSGESGAGMTLFLVAAVDPRVRLHEASVALKVDSAADDQGRSLLLGPESGGREVKLRPHPSEEWFWQVEARLRYPEGDARRIALLSGRLRAAVVRQTVAIDLPTLDRETTQTVGGLRLTFRPLDGGDREGYVLTVLVHRDNLDDQDWRAVYQMLQRDHTMLWSDEQRRRISVVSASNPTFDQNFDEKDMELHLRSRVIHQANGKVAAMKPVRLHWDVPLSVDDVEVPVRFTDLPLP